MMEVVAEVAKGDDVDGDVEMKRKSAVNKSGLFRFRKGG